MRLHIEKVKAGRTSKLYSAINEYGVECFEVSIIEGNIEIDDLNAKEKYYINQFNSILEGYNTTSGGEGRTNYADIDDVLVIGMAKEGVDNKAIAREFGVSTMTIQRILRANNIYRYGKINDSELVELWQDNTINWLAKYYGVNEKTIRRHAKKLGLRKR